MQGKAEKPDVTARTYFAATTEDCGSPLSNLQAASGRSRSLSALSPDRLLHDVRRSRVDDRAFRKAPLDLCSVLCSGWRDLDSRRISLPPLCPSRPLSTRQRLNPAFLHERLDPLHVD